MVEGVVSIIRARNLLLLVLMYVIDSLEESRENSITDVSALVSVATASSVFMKVAILF